MSLCFKITNFNKVKNILLSTFQWNCFSQLIYFSKTVWILFPTTKTISLVYWLHCPSPWLFTKGVWHVTCSIYRTEFWARFFYGDLDACNFDTSAAISSVGTSSMINSLVGFYQLHDYPEINISKCKIKWLSYKIP